MRTYTKTGIRSSAAGTLRSDANDNKFMIVVQQWNTQYNLSRGVLYADIAAISAWAEGQGHS